MLNSRVVEFELCVRIALALAFFTLAGPALWFHDAHHALRILVRCCLKGFGRRALETLVMCCLKGQGGGGTSLRIPENEAHPKPSSKRIENVSFATLTGHLKGGVHDRPFKQYLTREHLMEIVLAIGVQVLRQNLCDEIVSYCSRGPV